MMHVAILNKSFPEYTIQLANALSGDIGIAVTVIFPKGHTEEMLGKNWNHLLHGNIQLKLLQYGKGKSLKNMLRMLLSTCELVRYIKRNKPDIIHIQESGDAVVALALPFIREIPIVATIHDIKAHSGREAFLREFLRRTVVRQSRCIFVHGHYLKQLAISSFGLRKDNVNVIPHGSYSVIRDSFKSRIQPAKEEKTILFFGHMYKYKGLRYLVEAEPLISAAIPEAKIIIAGSGPDFQNYEATIQSRQAFEYYNEYIPNEKAVNLLNRASVVVLPYTEASQSGIVSLAFTFGKPVVVTSVGSIPEVVDDGQTGIVIPPKNSQALAKAVIQLLNDDKKRERMSQNAYRKAKTTLSWERIAGQTSLVYKQAIKTT